jgi:hypothetical protein
MFYQPWHDATGRCHGEAWIVFEQIQLKKADELQTVALWHYQWSTAMWMSDVRDKTKIIIPRLSFNNFQGFCFFRKPVEHNSQRKQDLSPLQTLFRFPFAAFVKRDDIEFVSRMCYFFRWRVNKWQTHRKERKMRLIFRVREQWTVDNDLFKISAISETGVN